MVRINKLSARHFVLVLYHLIVGSIIAANIRPDLWLMGWDGLYPELNVWLNIIRGLSAGWQEYYGVGLVGGHGFAATLPHTLIIGVLATVIPQHLVRQLFIFLCYYLGGLGMLLVSNKILKKLFEKELWFISLITALYYLLNLGTIQVFYVPLEAFTVHFVAWPWLTYFTILLLEKLTLRRVGAFTLALVLTSIQGFIPALFVTYATSLLFITGSYLVMHRFQREAMKAVAIIWLCVAAANAYWIGPVAYFSLTESRDYITAYNNVLSTPEFVGLSVNYGDLPNVALLRSFLWQSYELGGPIMRNWISHWQRPSVPAVGYFFFGLTIIGTLAALTAKRRPLMFGFVLSFLYMFGNVAIDIEPFGSLVRCIQSQSPELNQVFRVTFTKFGGGLSFYYALFLGIGISVIIRRFRTAGLAILMLLLLCYGYPVWQGNLVYNKLFISLPRQYIELKDYLNSLPEGKIADFPQDCAEGWYNTLWGYFGSGHLWYGVKHPFMARAFDVWSKQNENYYWELSTALRQQDYQVIEQVFNKYGVRYVLYDQNVTHCRSQKGNLSSLDFSNYMRSSANYTKRASFSAEHVLPITVYERRVTSTTYSEGERPKHIDRQILETLNPTPVATIAGELLETVPCQEAPHPQQSLLVREDKSGTTRLISTNADYCLSALFDDVNTSKPYIVEIESRHVSGQALRLSVENKGRPVGLELWVPTDSNPTYFYIPPTFPSELLYTVTIRNTSNNRFTTMNEVVNLILYDVDDESSSDIEQIRLISPDIVNHFLTWLYVVPAPTQQTLVLNQAYDRGWLAIANGKRLSNHTIVNGWANGWSLTGDEKNIIIIFWPQLLEFAGFGLLLFAVIIIIVNRKRLK